VLRVGRAGFYAWLGREESQRAKDDRRLALEVRALFAESKETYGSPRISGALRTAGTPMCRHRIAKLMRKEGLCARPRRKYIVTTNSKHEQPIAANLLERDFTTTAPNKVWAGDVTYLPTREGWLYFAVLLDLFSRRVVGWAFSERNDEQLTLSALHLAVDQRCPVKGLIHHSDRGATYASGAYQDELIKHGLVCSMSRKGDCWDNAVVESFFSTLDIECARGKPFATHAAARKAVTEYVLGFYNPTRLHSYLGYTSPMEFERAA
jgi:transposase InsO family protein